MARGRTKNKPIDVRSALRAYLAVRQDNGTDTAKAEIDYSLPVLNLEDMAFAIVLQEHGKKVNGWPQQSPNIE